MPRPNPPRAIGGEVQLARRIAFERDRHNMTYEGLASRMNKAGCPIQPSGLYKIERGKPPRRILVDELLALAECFNTTVEQLLRPIELVLDEELASLVDLERDALYEFDHAQSNAHEAARDLAGYVEKNPEVREKLNAMREGEPPRFEILRIQVGGV